MNRNKALLVFVLLGSFGLAACSGKPGGVVCPPAGCVVGGNATVTLTLRATPLTPPANTNLLSFVTTITGISLTPSFGNAVAVANTSTLDFVRLQSNSLLLGTVTAPAGSYTGITISFSAPTVTYCTQPTSGVQGCLAGSIATIGGAASAPQIAFTATFAANQQAGIEINLNTATAFTVTNQVVSAVNLGVANAFTAATLPPTASSLGTGQLDFFENILGVVTAASAQSVTVKTSNYGTYTALISASTFFSPNCVLTNVACSPAVGQLVSMDTAINPDGTLALLVYDPLSSVEIGWVDGLVTAVPSSSTQFQVVAGDQATATGGVSTLPNGTIVNVTLVAAGGGGAPGTPFPFLVDSRGLTIPVNSFVNSTDATNILPGMTVGLHVVQFTPAAGNTPASVSADVVTLRYSYVSGAIASPGAPNFNIQSLSTFFGLTGNTVVEPSSGVPATNFDGVTGASNLTVGGTTAISALYFGPTTITPFVAAKVRAF
jgi:hypothetical protein